jgi:excisionase family DNA binding protein
LEDGFVKVMEAAKYLSVSRSTIYELMGSGALPYAKIGRSRRIPRRALIELAEKSLVWT